VHLSTIHRTKGLEWPVVVIPGLQEKLFPYTARGDENLASLLESERRLLYVGMTRAINSLHLLTCSETEGDDRLPSRFVAEFHFGLSNELGGTLYGRDSGERSRFQSRPQPLPTATPSSTTSTWTARTHRNPMPTTRRLSGMRGKWSMCSLVRAVFCARTTPPSRCVSSQDEC